MNKSLRYFQRKIKILNKSGFFPCCVSCLFDVDTYIFETPEEAGQGFKTIGNSTENETDETKVNGFFICLDKFITFHTKEIEQTKQQPIVHLIESKPDLFNLAK